MALPDYTLIDHILPEVPSLKLVHQRLDAWFLLVAPNKAPNKNLPETAWEYADTDVVIHCVTCTPQCCPEGFHVVISESDALGGPVGGVLTEPRYTDHRIPLENLQKHLPRTWNWTGRTWTPTTP